MLDFSEIFVNKYWIFDNEPFYIRRFGYENKIYLMGVEQHNSKGIELERERLQCGMPSEDLLRELIF